MLVPSPYQEKIYYEVIHTQNNIVVQATAGAGKTTTILECLKLVPRFKRSIFLSFSNAIVKELKDRVPQGIQASTLHSLGFRILISHYGECVKKIEENKYFRKCLVSFYSDKKEKTKEDFKNCFRVQDICSFIRMSMVELEYEKVRVMCEYYNIDYTEQLIKYSIELLSKKEDWKYGIDFVDMLYLPIKLDLINIKYDLVFLDEAQDLNECQFQFLLKLRSQNGRMICVGDENQSVYGFMGSTVDVFYKLQTLPNTTLLTLPVSYRCGKKIVEKASTVSTLIKPFEENYDGIIRNGVIEEISEGDMVISRNTRPLILLFFTLLEQNKKSVIVGRDVEKGLLNIGKRIESSSYSGVLFNLQNEENKIKEELIALRIKNVQSHQRFIDWEEKREVLKLILKQCSQPSELCEKIKSLFHNEKAPIKLMTIHKSKGLENERVFMITRFNKENLLPSKYAKKEWELLQENNLEFVGYTRAKKELVFLEING